MSPEALPAVLRRLEDAARLAGRRMPQLLAVSKNQPATAVAELARCGQRAFGENYVQEASAKQAEIARMAPPCSPTGLEWHLIGHLQSNKAREAAGLFDWVHSIDRIKLVEALARHRDPGRTPLNVLIQVNIDDEASKQGCAPHEAPALARAIIAQPRLRLRGLMVIPAPHADPERRRPAFRQAKALFDALPCEHGEIDTLSMGMSDDVEIAIAEGATMVRIGTALFGARSRKA